MAQDLTFENFDKFQRKAYADRVSTVIRNFSPFYDEAFVLSLNAKYGAGKTTFLKMWKNQLETEGHKVIYINAWKTDFDDEPLIPIISALLDNIDTGQGSKKLKGALQGTLGAAALASNNLLSHTIGLNINEMMKEIETDLKASDIQAVGKDLYKEYSFKKAAYQSLSKELENYVESIDTKPLIIFVDELDRVRPDYSVRFLEAIKHIFSLHGICFVLAVDRKQLEASVRQLYGDIDFENYYLRFVTRETDLPEITKMDLEPFIELQGMKFIDEKKQSQILYPVAEPRDLVRVLDFITTVSRAFSFTPRQIETLFRYFSQVTAVPARDKAVKTAWIEAAVILCALFITDREVYRKIGAGTMSVLDLYEYFKALNYNHPPNNKNQRYVIYTVLACYLREDESLLSDIADTVLEYEGKVSKGAEGIERLKQEKIDMLARSVEDFGRIYEFSPFQYIYAIFEEWREFIE